MRIYKALDSLTRYEDIDRMARNLEDRFGPVPKELEDLFTLVRIRRIGEKLGFEKIIIKNGILIAFFINNQMSAYYRSDTFSGILKRISEEQNTFELKQNDSKLRIISRNIDSISKAYEVLKKLEIWQIL